MFLWIFQKEKEGLENKKMNFNINYNKENLTSLIRSIGYAPTSYSFAVKDEFSFIRPLSSKGYPRFHLYIKKNDERNAYAFNLHLDAKKPSYKGSFAHNAEYDSDLVKKEAERIKNTIE